MFDVDGDGDGSIRMFKRLNLISGFESIFCFIGFIIISIIRRGKYTKVGTPTAFYLIMYGTIRFFIERIRTDALMFQGFKIAMIVDVVPYVYSSFLY